MANKFLWSLNLIAMLAIPTVSVFAQEPPPTAQDLILHPGDTITWTVEGPHFLRFGGDVDHNGPLTLTSFSDVSKVLAFQPSPDKVQADTATWKPKTKVTATVMKDAVTSHTEVPKFFFTCGFHPDEMVTADFTIAAGGPARTVEIQSAPSPVRWLLKTSEGLRKLTRP